MTPSTADGSEFHVSDSELDDGAPLRDPDASAARATRMPDDKIIFPRQMLYIEAVLYLLIALLAFGMGFLVGRNGNAKLARKDLPGVSTEKRLALEGSVTFGPRSGAKQPDAGAVVIALPSDKRPGTPLIETGFRADDSPPGPNDANLRALTALGGAVTRVDKEGRFSLPLPCAATYRLLIISRHAKRRIGDPLESRDAQDIGRYFEDPRDLLRLNRYDWPAPRQVPCADPINTHFTTD